MSNLFQFKQFIINQDVSAMKVGTDGVLLGAWIAPKEGDLLDIGTGTGLLALMMAQKTNTAIIDAVEIDEQAYLQALANVGASKWKNRVRIMHTAVQNFRPNKKYDLIFSTPPYFIDSYKAENKDRNTARHTDELSFEELIKSVKFLLKETGSFFVILPTTEAQLFTTEALTQQLFLIKKCWVKPNMNKNPKRVMMKFSNQLIPFSEEELTIETEKRHQYTKEYINLTQDFYLNF